ncbi:Orn/DAP/Arg decarboxylase 2 [Sulfobacillus acidophilus DSM 10332]|uniref:Orn/DAP/Arg decarboxylase 2 n=1 Tax=Sulfobacillus acidophilus (strain ATCC 700253 / DSM 10332 / NAL) TaxID=679936 RepID=G8U142_SULAD|nr:Orn/DAP/Arg decarboxylase 2 [Sulfobacillus acidophilus DSM 10332]
MYRYQIDYPGVWENGRIYGRTITAILRSSPTPLFVVSPTRALDNSIRFLELTRNLTHSRAEVFYSVKTCSDTRIVRMISQSAVGAEVVSDEELELTRGLGFSRFIVDGAWKSSTILENAISSHCAMINVGHEDELPEIDTIARKNGLVQPIGVRLRLPHQSLLGLSLNELERVLAKLPKYQNIRLSRVHVHAGFNVLAQNIHPIIDTLQRGASIASAFGQHITTFDVGGGMAEMATAERDLDRHVATLVSSLITTPQSRLVFEPGRLIVGDAAVLVAFVVRRTPDNVLIIDTSAELLGFLSGQTPLVGVWTGGRPSSRALSNMIVRGVWESDHDYIEAELPADVTVGDKLLFLNCGAYVLSFREAFSPYRSHIVYIE